MGNNVQNSTFPQGKAYATQKWANTKEQWVISRVRLHLIKYLACAELVTDVIIIEYDFFL